MASLGRLAQRIALSVSLSMGFLVAGCGVKDPNDYRFASDQAGGNAGARGGDGGRAGNSGGNSARGGSGNSGAANAGASGVGTGGVSSSSGGAGGTGSGTSGNSGDAGSSGASGGVNGGAGSVNGGASNAGGVASVGGSAGVGGAVKPPPMPLLVIAPTSANFGKVTLAAQSAVVSFEVTNQGDAETAALAASITGTDASAFSLAGTECVAKKLAAGARCSLGVRFAPTTAGARTASLVVTGANEVKAALSAEGVTPSALSATPTVAEFASVSLGSATTYTEQTITIKNSEGQTSGALSTSITGATDFSVRSDTCKGATLAQSQACSIVVRFAPTTRGLKNATLEVSGMPGGLVPVSLAGRALAAGTFSIAPLNPSFTQQVTVGSTGTETLTLTVSNSGDVAATPTITLSNATQFGVVDNCSAKSIPAGGSCSVVLTLKPTSVGSKSTDVTVSPGTGSVKTTVTGVGREARVVNVTVTGSGKVTAAAGAQGNGINCPTDCSETYYQTTATAPEVTLTATYDASVTVTWSGVCAGSTTSCKLSASAATNAITVTFAKKRVTLSVTRTSVTTGATGTVSGGGINCGTTCSVAVDYGSTVTLTAAPSGTAYYFGGWSGGGCVGGALSCTTQALTADTTVNAKFTPPNVVFVSSAKYSVAQLRAHDPMAANDGVRGADQYCKDLAASGTGANLSGRTWVSLLTHGTAIGTNTWISRVGVQRGWVRVDGKPFGDTPDSIQSDYVVYYPPALDQNGARVAGNTNFAIAGSGCNDWTVGDSTGRRGAGRPAAGAVGWISAYGIDCSNPQHLYCMSIDYTATVTAPAPVAGRKWFLSDGNFTPGAGQSLTTADALCQSEATKAGYSGTFKALMASVSPATTAIARMNLTGAAWVRPDGVPVVSAPSDLNVAEPVLIAAPQVSASKKYYGNVAVWTGATSATATPTPATSCTPSGASSWTGGAGFTGSQGQPFFADFWYFYGFSSSNCEYGGQLYCLEQ
ncbi:MAG: choice-of-anchor D domain-containing protein [Myxococcota bacterium]